MSITRIKDRYHFDYGGVTEIVEDWESDHDLAGVERTATWYESGDGNVIHFTSKDQVSTEIEVMTREHKHIEFYLY